VESVLDSTARFKDESLSHGLVCFTLEYPLLVADLFGGFLRRTLDILKHIRTLGPLVRLSSEARSFSVF